MYFCFHFSTKLEDTESKLLKSNFEQNLIGQITFAHSSKKKDSERACVFIDAFVEIPRDYLLRQAIAFSDSDLAITYSDFAWMPTNAGVPKPALLPDWSPERFLAIDYLGPLIVVMQDRIGLQPNSLEMSRTQIILEAMAAGSKISRIPDLQYVQRSEQCFEDSVLREAEIAKFLLTHRNGAQVVSSNHQLQQIVYSNRQASSVSIIIPTRGTCLNSSEAAMVVNCVESLIKQDASELDVEIVVVFDTDSDSAYLEEIQRLTKNSNFSLLLVPYDPPFNFSSKCNMGASRSNGEVLIFLNDDTLCISKNVISELVALSQISDVGAVGAKLLFQGGLVQHGGYIIRNHAVGHAYIKEVDSPRVYGDLLVTHEVAGVTGACIAQRREVFDLIGMWDESLPSSYNDVDFCFRVSSRGFRVLQANNVVLNHFESITRNPHVSKSDRKHIEDRWPTHLASERFFRSIVQTAVAKSPAEKGLMAYVDYGRKVFKDQGIRGLLLLVINVAAKAVALAAKLISKDSQ